MFCENVKFKFGFSQNIVGNRTSQRECANPKKRAVFFQISIDIHELFIYWWSMKMQKTIF